MLRSRPITRTRAPIRVVRRRRRWSGVSWWFSILLVVPLALIAADRLFGISPVDDDTKIKTIAAVTFQITDADSGQPLPGAEVRAGQLATTSDDQGKASLSLPAGPVTVTVQRDGYEPLFGNADESVDRTQRVALRSQQPGQTQTDAGATETAGSDAANNANTTDTQPTSTATAAPATAPTADSSGGAAVAGELTGRVTTDSGDPIRGALVRIGTVIAKTKRNGTFRMQNAPEQGELVVSASGYADHKQPLPVTNGVEVALARQQIEAIYLSGVNAGDPDIVDRLIKIADETEINAIVVDIKENYVWYDTGVQFFRDADSVQASYEPRELVAKLHEHGIYAIARSVVFNDPLVAENRSDLAVKDEDGRIWRGWDDGAWVNPFNQELWQPNIDLAVEAAGMGFDEIQYDYIRFPSDGDLTTTDFGPNYTEEGRVATIVDFLKLSKKALEPTGAKLAVDIFGIVAIYPDDQGIGQRLVDIAPVVDYVCPMIYPSHFDKTSIDVGGEPNDFPYETIQLSLELAKQKMPGLELKLRPWLQDFDLGRDYTTDDVQAQIRASDEADVSGWLLWNAANEYTDDALAPQS